MGAFILVMLHSCARASEPLPLRVRHLVAPTPLVPRSWSLLIAPREDGQCMNTNLTDLLVWKCCHWMEKVVVILQTGDKGALVFPFSYHQFRTEFLKKKKKYLNLQNVTLSQARHSGPSIDRAMNVNPQRMQVARAVAHGPERPALREKPLAGSRFVGAASSNARIARHFRTTCPGGSHSWNQPRLCLHRRLKRQYILHLFAHVDVVANRIRTHGVPLHSMCKDQTSWTLQRSYRANLRRDIKRSSPCRRSVDSATRH